MITAFGIESSLAQCTRYMQRVHLLSFPEHQKQQCCSVKNVSITVFTTSHPWSPFVTLDCPRLHLPQWFVIFQIHQRDDSVWAMRTEHRLHRLHSVITVHCASAWQFNSLWTTAATAAFHRGSNSIHEYTVLRCTTYINVWTVWTYGMVITCDDWLDLHCLEVISSSNTKLKITGSGTMQMKMHNCWHKQTGHAKNNSEGGCLHNSWMHLRHVAKCCWRLPKVAKKGCDKGCQCIWMSCLLCKPDQFLLLYAPGTAAIWPWWEKLHPKARYQCLPGKSQIRLQEMDVGSCQIMSDHVRLF